MVYWVRLGVIVGEVCATLFPGDTELVLTYLVSDPVIAHVDRLGALELDVVVCYAHCTLVVTYDCSGVLRVAQVGQDVACIGCFCCVSRIANAKG